ncbi:hypothetical protein HMPREF0208_03304 [Citrobacter koseri]|nr:hypothetical protein HMPREF0208_03304 [Citrobacter koseri]
MCGFIFFVTVYIQLTVRESHHRKVMKIEQRQGLTTLRDLHCAY